MEPNTASAAQVVVSGTAEVVLPADRASFSVGIQTSGASALAASTENARISKSVLDALTSANLAKEDVRSTNLEVGPNWAWDEKTQRQKRVGFTATNLISIQTRDLPQLGRYIDAALSAGATDISDIAFSAQDTSAARRKALGDAVDAARLDAEAIAKAGGGTLGALLLLSTERINEMPGVDLQEVVVTGSRKSHGSVETGIRPSEIRVTARVIARWAFVRSLP
ncbi:MAG: SIMPL domain-containing protein [Proteobacteria bacterium]|nr:SIMPL domain-containing protein [Pseudomonadota bacterium]